MSKTKLIELEPNRIVDTVTLYEEYRLIEKDLSEINGAWRGIHLLLFFLAFVFGSFCTFCFHMLMFLFDEKCVLFPKLISLKEMSSKGPGTGNSDKGTSKQLIYDYISDSTTDTLPVDFVATHWVEKKTCYLPTYAPLLSGICGLIWTTMFLMCSSGSRALTGLQRAWRILPTVFVFSLAMSGLSIYTSFITQAGLDELCLKLAEITGSKTCSYTINVATLAYERRIRGVYQATRLTIMSAWMHTFCWIGAAFTAILRIILIVDFRLVKVQVDLRGNIEKMLERHEKHIRTDEFSSKDEQNSPRRMSTTSLKVRFVNKGFGTEATSNADTALRGTDSLHFISRNSPYTSEMSLMPDESRKLLIKSAAARTAKKYRFVIEILHGIVDSIGTEPSPVKPMPENSEKEIQRQQGVQNIQSLIWSSSSSSETESLVNREEAEQLARKFRHVLEHKATVENFRLITPLTLTPEQSQIEPTPILKLKLSNRGVQTDDAKKTVSQRVQISSPKPSILTLRPEETKLTGDTTKPQGQKEIATIPTTDLLLPSVEQEKQATESTIIPPQPPEKGEKQSTVDILKTPDKQKKIEKISTTDTRIPPKEKEWRESEKQSEYGLVAEKPAASPLLGFTMSLVESVSRNEDTMSVKVPISSKEKLTAKKLDTAQEKDEGKISKNVPPKPQELELSQTKEVSDRQEPTILKDLPSSDVKKEKLQELGSSPTKEVSDQREAVEKDEVKTLKELPPSDVKKEKPPEVGPSQTTEVSDQREATEKDESKSIKGLPPSDVKEGKSEMSGPSKIKEESDQRDEKDIKPEKPKKTDKKEKQD